MNVKKVVGIALIILGAGLLVLAIVMISSNLATTGPAAGKINSYKPPFRNHGLLTILVGIASVISFLTSRVSMGPSGRNVKQRYHCRKCGYEKAY